jgi:hypothetical protein
MYHSALYDSSMGYATRVCLPLSKPRKKKTKKTNGVFVSVCCLQVPLRLYVTT